jgi:hypothetical protein
VIYLSKKPSTKRPVQAKPKKYFDDLVVVAVVIITSTLLITNFL